METSDKTYDLKSLTKSEVKTIIESLLFSSSVDVCGAFYKDNVHAMFELAKKIRSLYPDVTLEDINIVPVTDENDNLVYHDEHTGDMVSFFPEIVQELKIK